MASARTAITSVCSPVLKAVLAIGLAAVLTIVAIVGGSSAAGAATVVPAKGLLFGAAVSGPPTGTISALETGIGRTLAIDRVYSEWNDVQPSSQARTDVSVGRIPLISIRPELSNGTKISWADVADGSQDAAIRTQAEGIEKLGKTVMLAFHHEADLSTGFGTAAQFRAAFAHYVSVVRSTGEHNISFVLILAANTYGKAISQWYPGDSVVDWAGADAYNFGACRSGLPPWRTFAQSVAPFEAWGKTHDKPQVLAEWGTVEQPGNAQGKAQWITAAGQTMRSWPRLRAASYFDESGTCDWRLTTSTAAMQAFTTLARSVYGNGRLTARLTLKSVSAGHMATWSAADSTGSHYITGHGITSWSFSPGDGTAITTGTGRPGTLFHRYAAAGSYSATLTVHDATRGYFTTHLISTIG
jgi:hypothetical protein